MCLLYDLYTGRTMHSGLRVSLYSILKIYDTCDVNFENTYDFKNYLKESFWLNKIKFLHQILYQHQVY